MIVIYVSTNTQKTYGNSELPPEFKLLFYRFNLTTRPQLSIDWLLGAFSPVIPQCHDYNYPIQLRKFSKFPDHLDPLEDSFVLVTSFVLPKLFHNTIMSNKVLVLYA